MSVVCVPKPASPPKKKSPILFTHLGFPKLGLSWSITKQSVHFTYWPKEKKVGHKTHQMDKTGCKNKSVSEQIDIIVAQIDYMPEKLDLDGIRDFIGCDIVCISTFVRTYNCNEIVGNSHQRYQSHLKKKQISPPQPYSIVRDPNPSRDDLTTSERNRLYQQIRTLKNELDDKCVECEVLKKQLAQTEKEKNKLQRCTSIASLKEMASTNLSTKTPKQQCSFLYDIVKGNAQAKAKIIADDHARNIKRLNMQIWKEKYNWQNVIKFSVLSIENRFNNQNLRGIRKMTALQPLCSYLYRNVCFYFLYVCAFLIYVCL